MTEIKPKHRNVCGRSPFEEFNSAAGGVVETEINAVVEVDATGRGGASKSESKSKFQNGGRRALSSSSSSSSPINKTKQKEHDPSFSHGSLL